jgi:hypothetical protein
VSQRLLQVVAELAALTPRDFDPMVLDAAGEERLQQACQELLAHYDPKVWAPALFALMERLDESDLGSPGPIVHTLEACAGYRPLLAESLRRKPTSLTTWMANRILNADPVDADDWLDLLQGAAEHPKASPRARTDAREFLHHQGARR